MEACVVGTHETHLTKAMLVSTHNLCVYGETINQYFLVEKMLLEEVLGCTMLTGDTV